MQTEQNLSSSIEDREDCRSIHSRPETQGVAQEMQVIKNAIHSDPDYAWSWFCNLKMSFVDEGCDPIVASHGSGRFMGICFEYDIKTNPLYVQVEKKILGLQ